MTNYRITSIDPQKRHPQRRNVFLDGAFAFGLDEEVVLKHHLYEGDEISESTIQNILLEEETTRAKKKAFSLLSYRARSVGEIRERLGQKGYDENIVESIIEDLCRVDLLNDESFASAYVQTRMIQKPLSKRLLIQELKQKGVDTSLATRAVNEGYGSRSEVEVAKALIEPRLKRYQHEDAFKVRKKISDFLARRGFGWEIVSEVVRWKEMLSDES